MCYLNTNSNTDTCKYETFNIVIQNRNFLEQANIHMKDNKTFIFNSQNYFELDGNSKPNYTFFE